MNPPLKKVNIELNNAWRQEYLKLGNKYALNAALLLVFTFPMIIAANYTLIHPENLFAYTVAYLLPSVLVGAGLIIQRFINYRHEVLVALMFGSIFFASAFRTDENSLLIYLIINVVSFIVSSVQMLVFPVLNSYFVAYILVVHPLIAYVHYGEGLDVYFSQHGGVVMIVLSFVFSGVNSLRYQIMKKNFITSLELQKSYVLLSEKSKIIEENAQQLTEQNNNITASITYAKRIQEAILPRLETISQAVPSSFIFFKPRDIVSGDFYWFANLKELTGQDAIILAAVDCTGHGVPGAFMSMIGNTFLNQIVNENRVFMPDEILNQLDLNIQKALKQDNNQNWDGMDMSLVHFNRDTKTLYYAGAKNPLCYIKDGKLNIIKANNFPVGGFYREDKFFKYHKIPLNGSEVFYLFSDGFQDQFGGEKNKKFTVTRFHKLLLEIHKLPFYLQKEKLEEALLYWQGKEEQIDDVLVIGFRP